MRDIMNKKYIMIIINYIIRNILLYNSFIKKFIPGSACRHRCQGGDVEEPHTVRAGECNDMSLLHGTLNIINQT